MSRILDDSSNEEIMHTLSNIYERIANIEAELTKLQGETGNICNLIKCCDKIESSKEKQQDMWDIKFVKDGETIELIGTFNTEEECRQGLAYYRSKYGIGVRYFMEKRQ